MSTSANTIWLKKAMTQLYVTLFVALFGAIYEHFSHEVYSFYMIYAFAIPLVLGVLPYSLAALHGAAAIQIRGTKYWNAGICTLTLGSVFQGVLIIAGYTNRLIAVYPIAGVAMLALGLITALRRTPDAVKDE